MIKSSPDRPGDRGMKVLWTSLGLFLLSAITMLAADEPSAANQEQQNIDLALRVTREAAMKYEFTVPSDGQNLKLREQPILSWSNPERGQIYGNVFLWTNHGRPAVVGSLFKWFSPFTHTSHEFHSLTDKGLTTKFAGAAVWTTDAPGIALASYPEPVAVAANPTGRLAQMRQMARQFSVRRTERDGQKNEMRLLSQPVYRYEISDNTACIDGGLFVFVQGTDPELWLLLEAHGNVTTTATWKYAVARMNSVEFSIEHGGRTVAHFDIMPFSEVHAHKATYTSFGFDK